MTGNALLITVDSLRYDRLPANTPHSEYVDHLSLKRAKTDATADPIQFSKAYATGPGTTPSFPALLTGTLALSHGGLGPLTDDRPRLAAHLSDRGLSTGGFQCNPFLAAHSGYDRGFDRFEDYQNPLMGLATRVFPRGIEVSNPRLRRIDDLLHLTDGIKRAYRMVAGKPRPYVPAEVITDDAVEWLSTVDTPFFGWVHYMDVHHPCHPPREYRDRFGVGDVDQSTVAEWYSALLRDPETLSESELAAMRDLYDAAVAYTDDQVGRILDHLRETGRFEDTLVVLTSDHGELFGEHGGYGKPERMYDELLHVPLVVANAPDRLRAATDDLVSLLDVPPLICDALDLPVPDAYEGRVPGVDDPREYVLAEHEVEGEVIVGARSRDWLYEGDEIAGAHRLFDCRDGFEQVAVDSEAPGAATVREAVLARLDDLDVEAGYLQADWNDDVEDRLEDLGYL